MKDRGNYGQLNRVTNSEVAIQSHIIDKSRQFSTLESLDVNSTNQYYFPSQVTGISFRAISEKKVKFQFFR